MTAAASTPPAAGRPNVVVFLTDQQRFDSTGVHGNPLGLTPNFDRLATEGTFCAQAFTPQPVCAPARAALQTGRHATAAGVHRNELALPADADTIAKRFAAGGYETAYVGKWHLAGTDDGPVPPPLRGGYDHWFAADVVEFISDVYDARLYDSDGVLHRLPGYRADAYVDAAIDYLTRPHDRPFFLFVSLIEPHHRNQRDDYPAPDGYREQYEGRWTPPDLAALGGVTHQHLAGYWGMVKRVDEAFGRLRDALHSLALTDDTIVAFTTDHGCHFKTRNDEYKRSAHEASIRLPLAIDGPTFHGGGRVRSLVSLIDLAPTLLDACGLPVPDAMHGRSLLPVLRGTEPDERREVLVQISESQVARALRTTRWKYVIAAPDADPWNDTGSPHYVETELYDLDSDPHELENLAGLASHRRLCDVLGTRIARLMVSAGEVSPQITPAPSRAPGQRTVSSADAWL